MPGFSLKTTRESLSRATPQTWEQMKAKVGLRLDKVPRSIRQESKSTRPVDPDRRGISPKNLLIRVLVCHGEQTGTRAP